MKKKVVIFGVAVAFAFGVGIIGKIYLAPMLSPLHAVAAEQIDAGKNLLDSYFSDVKFLEPVLENDESSPLKYSSGDWIITTDNAGDSILSVALSPEAANKAELEQKEEVGEEILMDLAKDEICKYEDVKYTLDFSIEDQNQMKQVTVVEINEGIETGLSGLMYFYPDGTLFSITTSPRSIEDFSDVSVMTEEDAYRKAFEAVKSARPDWEVIDEFDTEEVELTTGSLGQVYIVGIYGMKNDMKLYSSCVMYAKSGKIIEISYSDY